jgi:mono/diheme cytochrome c family protein
MKGKYLILILISALFLGACGSVDGTERDDNEQTEFNRSDTPAEFADLINPLRNDDSAVDSGKKIYQSNCASCHGSNGKGDGAAAQSLDPAPSNLAGLQAGLSDGYVFWRISEGGLMEPFRSSMPAWKTILIQDQIWELIAYIRTLGD